MGIQGLLPLLKSISDPVHVSAYAGHRVGIDAYSWLHRGGHQCATELALHLPTDRHLAFCLTRLQLLLSHNVKPVLVFDGGRLPSKQHTEHARSARRHKERQLGVGLWEAGQKAAAFKAFQKCVSIHPGMAYQLIRLCEGMEGVEWVVAPYEADAQLAYLSLSGFVSAVISEDSDLLLFGCRRVLYKMDAAGHGLEIRLSNLGACTDLPMQHWSHAQFVQMCILAGCDYLPSLPSFGLKKAHAAMRAAKTWDKAIRRIRLEGRTSVYAGYEDDFHCALLCFQHQRVWDPQQRRLTFLTQPSEEVKAAFPDLSFLGPDMDDDVAARIAKGELHPETLRKFGEQDMEGVRQEKQGGALRRTQSEGELVSADADVGRVPPLAPSMALVLRAKSKVEGISALLVKNKIDGYFVGASQASRSNFIRPRSTKEADTPADDPVRQGKVARSTSASAVEMHTTTEVAAVGMENPFATFAYKRKAATAEEGQSGTEPSTSAEDGEVEEKAGDRCWTDVNGEQRVDDDDDEWEDRYDDAATDDHAHLLTHAYSLPLGSVAPSSLHDSPLLLPPDMSSHTLPSSHSTLASTFADSPPVDLYTSPSASPSPPDLPPASSPILDDASPSPSPSPSPPPLPSGPVFSKYFPSHSPAASQPSILTPSPPVSLSPSPPSSSPSPLPPSCSAPPPLLPLHERDELLISDDDDDDDVQAADSGSDKENVDRNLLPPSSQTSHLPLPHPPLDDDDIEDVPSPPFRPTPSPPPLFSAKRSSRSLSPPPSITPLAHKRGSHRPVAYPLSAPTAAMVGARVGGERGEGKRMRVEGVVGGNGSEVRGVRGGVGVSFFDQFRYVGGSHSGPAAAPRPALPPPPLPSYALTARQLRR